ncbi:TcfC E-set like domain-containing protein, partial [Enterobacter hormaechei]|uniref:TcfC E-set like domain-containing protein n=1 Tax=Enterobacter hormaechei TaxID=158836 RepID=UPI002040C31F
FESERLLQTFYLQAGVNQLDTRSFPMGSYNVTAAASALVALPALHEPLQARIGPVTTLVERGILAAHQHAVFVDAQGDV